METFLEGSQVWKLKVASKTCWPGTVVKILEHGTQVLQLQSEI